LAWSHILFITVAVPMPLGSHAASPLEILKGFNRQT
jgi:hypothetical protein